jgi:hypothetical protein
MVECFADQLRAERDHRRRGAPARHWRRVVHDLLVSAPTEHWEEIVARTTALSILAAVFAFVAFSVVTRTLFLHSLPVIVAVVGGVRWATNTPSRELTGSRLRRVGLAAIAAGIVTLPFMWWSGLPEILLVAGTVAVGAGRALARPAPAA